MLDEFKEIIITLLPPAAGSALSVIDAKHQFPSAIYAFLEFLFGLCVAIYLGQAISELFAIPLGTPKSLGISFTVGYIGLTTLREIKSKISEIVVSIVNTIKSIIERYSGK